MKEIEIVKQEPAFVVSYSDYNNSYSREVSWKELSEAPVGKSFRPDVYSCCGRDVNDTEATVLYKDAHGVLVRFVTDRTEDSPNAEELASSTNIVYFEF